MLNFEINYLLRRVKNVRKNRTEKMPPFSS